MTTNETPAPGPSNPPAVPNTEASHEGILPSNTETSVLPPPPVTRPDSAKPRGFSARILGGEKRIPALDVARGIAIVGMFMAHMLTLQVTFPENLVGISHGRSAALFAFLAGISLSIIAGRDNVPTGTKLLQVRMRVIIRALLLLVTVSVLTFFNTGIQLILGFYAGWFLFSLPFLHWPARRLLILAGGLIVVGIPLSAVATELLTAYGLDFGGYDSAVYIYLMSGVYGGMGFMAYIFAGLALGRLGFALTPEKARKLAKKTLAVGALLLLIGTGGGTLIDSIRLGHPSQAVFDTEGDIANFGSSSPDPSSSSKGSGTIGGSLSDASKPPSTPPVFPPSAGDLAGKPIPDYCFCDDPASSMTGPKGKPGKTNPVPNDVPYLLDWNFWYTNLIDPTPHSNSLLEATGNLGFSMVIVSLLILGGRKLALVLFPLAAMGSMALTIYSAHVIWFAASNLGRWPMLPSFLIMLGVFAVFACVWRLIAGRGPLERLLHWASYRGSQLTDPRD